MSLSIEKLEELERKARAASKGRWKCVSCGEPNCWCAVVETSEIDSHTNRPVLIASAGSVFKADAEYIAAAHPEVILNLIAEVKSLR